MREDDVDPGHPASVADHLTQEPSVMRDVETIFGRVKARGIPYGSEPDEHTNGQINTRRGGEPLTTGGSRG